MRRRKRAEQARKWITHQAILHIRAMAYRREAHCHDSFPDADHLEQIRLLADLCDTLVPGDDPVSALQWTWRPEAPPGSDGCATAWRSAASPSKR
ncbi:hypothetical protein GCM10010171_30530 [Actinokineospora fastidiosa]|uniref:Uncharacterized protein n=1 Tax=Actinokineospora fastidiosa TaxID=1816 RepID=A0A918GGC2_9PSEU|nr:hypothetical protein GCM10010171_30530 [Actinokineospora fastidiosa]